LRRLREDAVVDFSEDYTALIVDFVADIHAEVLDAHDWSVFDTEVTVTTVASQTEYDLYTAASTPVTRESFLRYEGPNPSVFYRKPTSDNQGHQLRQISWQTYVALKNEDQTDTAEHPEYFAIIQNDDGWRLAVWPTPDNSDTEINMQWWIPEAAIAGETATTTDTVKVPYRPLVLGALMMALNERGEELGEPGNLAEQRYYAALGVAKETDIQNAGRVNRYEFYRE
jgi:hypothetical protein